MTTDNPLSLDGRRSIVLEGMVNVADSGILSKVQLLETSDWENVEEINAITKRNFGNEGISILFDNKD